MIRTALGKFAGPSRKPAPKRKPPPLYRCPYCQELLSIDPRNYVCPKQPRKD